MLALLTFWWWAYHEAFMFPGNSDPRNALIYVFLPIYGTVAAAMPGVTLRLVDRRAAP